MSGTLIGSQVAGYRIERVLGRGGMASVYFAWDTRNDRAVALKVMDERYRETPSYVDRFVQEAQTMIRWDSPHIVRVYDAGEENQIYYYAMEFIRGLDLAQLIRQYQENGQLMPHQDVTRIGWAVAEALDYAHGYGIIHRDVKPSNVLVSVDGRILLSDFGLVMDVNRGTLGETFGSPAYIAPEQAINSAAAVPQSDIYALGVMLFEMLTGVTPFHDPSPTALALKHVTEDPPMPRSLNPRLNSSVEAVLLRALRKKPRERYATGRELMSALDRSMADTLRSERAQVPPPLPDQTQVFLTQRAQPLRAGAPVATVEQVIPAREVLHVSPPSVNRGAASPRVSTQPTAQAYSVPAVPERSRGGMRWGCLAGLLAAVGFAVLLGAALALSQPGRALFGGFGAQATDQPSATSPAQEATVQPTEAPAATDLPTETLEPTQTTAPTDTPALPTPTATVTITPEPFFSLLLAYQKSDGFVLVNAGEMPLPLEPFEIRSIDDEEKVFVSGDDWELVTLEPGECVTVWEQDARPQFPPGVRCEPVGKVLIFERDERFWTERVAMFYEDQQIEVCDPKDKRCEFDTRPE